jgi:hypothetical protein
LELLVSLYKNLAYRANASMPACGFSSAADKWKGTHPLDATSKIRFLFHVSTKYFYPAKLP